MTFHDLYEQYAKDVYRFAWYLCGNSAEAEDITSEVFIRAWNARGTLRTETIKAYLFTIARNLYLKQKKKERRLTDLDDAFAATTASPEAVASARAELNEVLAALNLLPEIDRSALIMHAHHELPYEEIARVLNISAGAARVKVYRARRKLMLLHSAENEPL